MKPRSWKRFAVESSAARHLMYLRANRILPKVLQNYQMSYTLRTPLPPRSPRETAWRESPRRILLRFLREGHPRMSFRNTKYLISNLEKEEIKKHGKIRRRI